MKKVLKWLAGIIGLLALLLIGATIWWWPEIKIIKGTEELNGKKESIPASAPKITFPPLTTGKVDWPCWRGTKNDGRNDSKGISKDWRSGLKKLWEVNFLCQGNTSATWSAPVVRGNRLVICGRDKTSDLVFCLAPTDGKIIWKSSYPTRADSSHGSGPRATPYIDDDRVYTFGRSGDLACWNLLNGKLIWHKNVGDEGGKEPRWGHSSSPLVIGKLVVVQGGGDARLIAYDKISGVVAWKSGKGTAGYAALRTIDLDGTLAILAFHGTGLVAVTVDSGTQLWEFLWKTSYDVNATTPIITGNRVFITSDYGAGGALLQVSKSDAKVLWRSEAISSHHSDPYIIDGHIYGYSGQSFQNNGTFKCIDLETGTEKWATNEMGWGTCLVVDGLLLCGDIRGNLFLMKPDPKGFTKVTEWRNALGKINGPVWTIPVIANGQLYLRFKQKLVCFQL